VRGGRGGEKPRITRRIVAIELGLDVLVAFDFSRDEFLCAFFWLEALSGGCFSRGT